MQRAVPAGRFHNARQTPANTDPLGVARASPPDSMPGSGQVPATSESEAGRQRAGPPVVVTTPAKESLPTSPRPPLRRTRSTADDPRLRCSAVRADLGSRGTRKWQWRPGQPRLTRVYLTAWADVGSSRPPSASGGALS